MNPETLGRSISALAYRLVYCLVNFYFSIKYWILRDYIVRVDIQAHQLYKESQLFNLRWQELGLEYAEQSYEQEKFIFIDKVRKGSLLIRLQLLWDSIIGAPYQAYYLAD